MKLIDDNVPADALVRHVCELMEIDSANVEGAMFVIVPKDADMLILHNVCCYAHFVEMMAEHMAHDPELPPVAPEMADTHEFPAAFMQAWMANRVLDTMRGEPG